MEKDIRVLYTEYNEAASRIFFSLFNEFRNEAETIERDSYENVFQLLKSRYASVLKHRLEQSAGNIIDKCDSAESQGRLRIGFSEKITYFLKEFTRKSGSI
jgi:hypothetical protein